MIRSVLLNSSTSLLTTLGKSSVFDGNGTATGSNAGEDLSVLLNVQDHSGSRGEGLRARGSRSTSKLNSSKVGERNEAVTLLEVFNNPFGVLPTKSSLLE